MKQPRENDRLELNSNKTCGFLVSVEVSCHLEN